MDELLVFEAISWDLRRRDDGCFFELVNSHPIYDVFDYAFGRGFPVLNKHKRIQAESRDLYHRLNPFGRNLRERLSYVAPEAVQALRKKLKEPVMNYVSRDIYARAEDTRYMHNMGSDDFFSKAKKTKTKAYLGRIAVMLRPYPREYVPPEPKPPAASRQAYQIPSLF